MQNNQNPFADRRVFIGIILVAVFMIGWQTYLAKKYPNMNQAKTVMPTTPAAEPVNAPRETAPGPLDAKTAVTTPADTLTPEALFAFEDEKVRFSVTSRGLGLKEYVLKSYKDSLGQPIRLGFSPLGSMFEVRLTSTGKAIDFDVREISKGSYEGRATTEVGTIIRRLDYHPENGSFESTITVDGATSALARGLTVAVSEMVREGGSSSWFFPSYNYQDFFVGHGGTTEAVNINHSKTDVQSNFKNASFVSVGDQYFSSAIMDRSEIAPEVNVAAHLTAKTALAELTYMPMQTNGSAVFKQILYSGPKSLDQLKSIDASMSSLIDFGFLAFIAKPLLYAMKWFHSIVGNWGWAIILLTLLVRFIVLPFNLMSIKNMKAMQKIQPLMTEVRERHKDDPMKQQQAIMALMKEHKANPIGGCLPMLLQIPIFFALYKVINMSVELYQSPFALWIHDLSAFDPYYVLPVLMGITMFIQSKMTPTAMDPMQAKIMLYLPLVFTVFMLHLPSGLTLYMVVSAVFGIIQQWFVLKGSPAPVPAKK